MDTVHKKACGRFAVYDQILVPKNQEQGSEDGILITPDVLAVFDGVTSENPSYRVDGMTPGQFAMENGKAALREAAVLDDPRHIVPYLTNALGDALRGREGIGRPGYVFIAYLKRHHLLIRTGDCSYLVNGVGNNPGLAVDDAKARARKILLERLLASGVPLGELVANDPTKELMKRMTDEWQFAFANSEDEMYGYAVINGKPVPKSKVEYIQLPWYANHLVLATDGYPPEVLRQSSVATHSELEALLMRDPLCIREWVGVRGLLPGNSVVDDCTALWARLE